MRRSLRFALLLLAAAGAAYYLLPVGGGGESPEPEPLALPAWEMIGCWEIRLTAWSTTPGAAGPEADSVGSGPGAGAGASGRRPPEAAAIPSPPRAVDPPGRVMLLPDSVDLWGRVLDSYRAVAVDSGSPRPAPVGAEARGARSLRWFTSRDTFWMIWREEGTRAGVALTRRDRRMRGYARALSPDSDVSAGAEAWPINCSTGAVESVPPWRRR